MHDGLESVTMSSSLSTLGLIGALFFAYCMFVVVADRWIHNRGEIIYTGLMGGIPASAELRRLMLFNSWLILVGAFVGSSFVFTVGFVGIARDAADSYAKIFAYLCAFQCSFGGVIWIVTGPSWFLRYRSVLRQAEPR
jgi:hypothetical protein